MWSSQLKCKQFCSHFVINATGHFNISNIVYTLKNKLLVLVFVNFLCKGLRKPLELLATNSTQYELRKIKTKLLIQCHLVVKHFLGMQSFALLVFYFVLCISLFTSINTVSLH